MTAQPCPVRERTPVKAPVEAGARIEPKQFEIEGTEKALSLQRLSHSLPRVKASGKNTVRGSRERGVRPQ